MERSRIPARRSALLGDKRSTERAVEHSLISTLTVATHLPGKYQCTFLAGIGWRGVQISPRCNCLLYKNIYSFLAKVFAICPLNHHPLRTMKQKLWITLATYLAYCIDKELYKAIDYLREQVLVLVEQQENNTLLMSRKRSVFFEKFMSLFCHHGC